jgi:hypothetical protein
VFLRSDVIAVAFISKLIYIVNGWKELIRRRLADAELDFRAMIEREE